LTHNFLTIALKKKAAGLKNAMEKRRNKTIHAIIILYLETSIGTEENYSLSFAMEGFRTIYALEI
jgi:hypothetical protein